MVIQMPILQPDQVCTEVAYPVVDALTIIRSETSCGLEKSADVCNVCKHEARQLLSSKNYHIQEA